VRFQRKQTLKCRVRTVAFILLKAKRLFETTSPVFLSVIPTNDVHCALPQKPFLRAVRWLASEYSSWTSRLTLPLRYYFVSPITM
jgi:hypothetical protein